MTFNLLGFHRKVYEELVNNKNMENMFLAN